MSTTTTIKFEERKKNQPIEFDGTKSVSEGCEVSLRKDGVDVLARITSLSGSESCVAEVTGYDGPDTRSLGIGKTIRFEQRHIFRCAA